MNLFWNLSQSKTAERHLPGIILAHGFGANAADLEGISSAIGLRARWFFPQGPVRLQQGSYAWFPSSAAEVEIPGAYFQNLADISIPELGERARELVSDARELGLEWDNCFIGGFSQGSMLALRALLECHLPVRGLILFSSTLIAKKETKELIASCPAVPVFQSHGIYDPLLPLQGAEDLRELLTTKGWKVEYHRFPGLHSIPPEISHSFESFISDQLR